MAMAMKSFIIFLKQVSKYIFIVEIWTEIGKLNDKTFKAETGTL